MYSFVRADISVQKTFCAGIFIPLHFCGRVFELKITNSLQQIIPHVFTTKKSCFSKPIFPVREKSMCGVVSVVRNIKTGYSLYRLQDRSCCSFNTLVILKYVINQLTTREIQFKIHMLKYTLQIQGEVVLIENLLNTSQLYNVHLSKVYNNPTHHYTCPNTEQIKNCSDREGCKRFVFGVERNKSHIYDKVASLGMMYHVHEISRAQTLWFFFMKTVLLLHGQL